MQKHIFHPIPPLDAGQSPGTREERIKTILTNVETQQQQVRSSIMASSQQKPTHTTASNDTNDPAPPPLSEQEGKSLAANLNAPYSEIAPDPYVPIGISAPGDRSVEQAPVPKVLRDEIEKAAMLEAYDRHAQQAKAFYVDALERQQVANGNGEVSRDPRKRPRGG